MFVITGKIGDEICSIRYASIKNIQKECKDTDTVFISGNSAFAGDKIAINKMLKENTVDHGYLGCVPSGCECRDHYLSGGLSAAELIYSYVFDSVISFENNWKWKNPPEGVVF
ncbi:MAG: hypothetical protein LBD93_04155 [Treponema sp.]|jgi:hypothetical protein|nr:hypothetical protein [Treponema sp.]